MPFEFGDVVLVPFPFTDQTNSKQRPAVIVSNRSYNLAQPDAILMPITSRPRSGAVRDLVFDWRAAGLMKSSTVKPVFATYEQRLISRRLGVLVFEDQASLLRMIGGIFG